MCVIMSIYIYLYLFQTSHVRYLLFASSFFVCVICSPTRQASGIKKQHLPLLVRVTEPTCPSGKKSPCGGCRGKGSGVESGWKWRGFLACVSIVNRLFYMFLNDSCDLVWFSCMCFDC